MRSRKLFVGVMACITAIAVTVMIDNSSAYTESATGEILNLVVDEPSLITTESFDVLKYEIEAKVTETEEDTEMTEELTTEMTTEPVTEEITEKVEEKPKKTQTQKKSTKKTQTKETQTKNNKPPKNADEAIKAVTEITQDDLAADEVTETSETLSEEITTQPPSTEESVTEEPATEDPKQQMYYNMSEDDIYTLAALIYLEAGSTSYKCQCAVGSVVLNLMMKEGKNLHQCIKTPGRFSVASRVYRTKPSSTSLEAARQIVTSGPTLPTYVTCFRNNHYFSWAKSYCCIDSVYFSYY